VTHTLEAFLLILSRVERFTDEERAAASLLAAATAREFPKGRLWTVLTDDQDPALIELECIGHEVSTITDTLALIEDRLTEIKRQRASVTASREAPNA
jgi:hypothetical protein